MAQPCALFEFTSSRNTTCDIPFDNMSQDINDCNSETIEVPLVPVKVADQEHIFDL